MFAFLSLKRCCREKDLLFSRSELQVTLCGPFTLHMVSGLTVHIKTSIRTASTNLKCWLIMFSCDEGLNHHLQVQSAVMLLVTKRGSE